MKRMGPDLIRPGAMAIFEIVRAWHMDLDLTHAKIFNDEGRLHLCAWARQALRFVLATKTVDSMK